MTYSVGESAREMREMSGDGAIEIGGGTTER
jgi:hypothetical protein